jgi:hypothetical protein
MIVSITGSLVDARHAFPAEGFDLRKVDWFWNVRGLRPEGEDQAQQEEE